VNTVLNQEGRLVGYNTDYFGAKKAIQEAGDISGKNVLMVGAGGVARAIGNAVTDLGGNLSIANRNSRKSQDLSRRLGASTVFFKKEPSPCYREYVEDQEGFLLINATQVGMDNPEEMIVSEQLISKFDAVMDVVVKPTRLIREARDQGKITIPGLTMTTYQAAKQFEIYTGLTPPEDLIKGTLGK